MGNIAIRLDPAKLQNPDLDIRYRLPDLLEANTKGRISDNGYDYVNGDTLVVYLRCDNPSSDVTDVIGLLADTDICGNRLLNSAIIGTCEDSTGTTFNVVHPTGEAQTFEVRPW